METLFAIDPLIKKILETKCDTNGIISYYDFIGALLYDPEIGYYRKDKKRVGYSSATDFYTAESLYPLFQELLLNAFQTILGKNSLSEYTFIELGAEPESKTVEFFKNHFKDAYCIRFMDTFQFPEKSIVFSNELFDAQPFFRLIFKNGKWQEKVVCLKENGISESLRTAISPELEGWLERLPNPHMEGYQIDIPLGAEKLFEPIAHAMKEGLLMAFDYGKSWENLIYETPQGTARGYYQHTQVNNLLQNLTHQDITCHICWDMLIEILKNEGYQNIVLESQESFFVKNSTNVIEKIINRQMKSLNKERQTLMELLHPGQMGQKFQVLRGVR